MGPSRASTRRWQLSTSPATRSILNGTTPSSRGARSSYCASYPKRRRACGNKCAFGNGICRLANAAPDPAPLAEPPFRRLQIVPGHAALRRFHRIGKIALQELLKRMAAANDGVWLNVHRGQPELAIDQFERAIRLSPFDPAGFMCFFGIADAHFLKGNYDEAVKWSHKGLNQQPAAAWHLRVLVPALFHAGRIEEAHHAFKKMMEHYPGLTIGKVRNALPFGADMVERIVDGLRKTGLPE